MEGSRRNAGLRCLRKDLQFSDVFSTESGNGYFRGYQGEKAGMQNVRMVFRTNRPPHNRGRERRASCPPVLIITDESRWYLGKVDVCKERWGGQ